MFVSRFLDNGSTDLEKVYSFEKGDSSAPKRGLSGPVVICIIN